MSARRSPRQIAVAPLTCAGAPCWTAGEQVCGDACKCQRVAHKLTRAGIAPTSQRRMLGAMLLCAPVHVTAEQLARAVQTQALPVSRATVYNTLRLFTERGLLCELPVMGAEAVYDSVTTPHHHFYDMRTGEVSDIDSEALQIGGLDGLAAQWDIDAVEVVVRGWRKTAPAAGA
jgi:Fur family iron response transcriptional regulator